MGLTRLSSFKKCVICGLRGEQDKTASCIREEAENQQLMLTWKKDCAETLCEILFGNSQHPLIAYFLHCKYCTCCLQAIRDLNFTLKEIKHLNSVLDKLSSKIRAFININYKTIGVKSEDSLLQNKLSALLNGGQGSDVLEICNEKEIIEMIFKEAFKDNSVSEISVNPTNTANTFMDKPFSEKEYNLHNNRLIKEAVEVDVEKSSHQNNSNEFSASHTLLKSNDNPADSGYSGYHEMLASDGDYFIKLETRAEVYPEESEVVQSLGNEVYSERSTYIETTDGLADNSSSSYYYPCISHHSPPQNPLRGGKRQFESNKNVYYTTKSDTSSYSYGDTANNFQLPPTHCENARSSTVLQIGRKRCRVDTAQCAQNNNQAKTFITAENDGFYKSYCVYCGKNAGYYKTVNGESVSPHYCGSISNCETRIPFSCELCSHVNSSAEDLRNHINNCHHPNQNSDEAQCPVCGEMLSSAASLQVHMRSHGGPMLLYKCPLCPKVYPLKSNLRKHVESHTQQTTYLAYTKTMNNCDSEEAVSSSHVAVQCNKTNNIPKENASLLFIDLPHKTSRIANNNTASYFPGNSTVVSQMVNDQSIMPQSSSLNGRKLLITENTISCSFYCSYCGKGYPQKNELNAHLFTAHSYFNGNYNMSTNNGDKQYSCKFCPHIYTDPLSLKEHLKADHSSASIPTTVEVELNSYQCDICEIYCANNAHDLKTHISRTHRDLKFLPTCCLCGRKCADQLMLNKHMLQAHEIETID